MASTGLFILFVLAPATVAMADQGAAINVAVLPFNSPVGRGEQHEVHNVIVSNPGSEAATYRVEVRPVPSGPTIPSSRSGRPVGIEPPPDGVPDTDTARPAEASWFTVAPAEFTLGPGTSKAVTVTLKVPAKAVPGRYRGLLVP